MSRSLREERDHGRLAGEKAETNCYSRYNKITFSAGNRPNTPVSVYQRIGTQATFPVVTKMLDEGTGIDSFSAWVWAKTDLYRILTM